MIHVDVHCLTQPVSIARLAAIVLTCTCFSLVASVQYIPSSYWAWCMFTWCFCFLFTLSIVILEVSTLSSKMPFAWDDFTTAFALLASLMCLTACAIYPTFFACNICYRQIGASVVAVVCSAVYVLEVSLTRRRPSGQVRGFLATWPGIMKMLEAFFACLIFTSLEKSQYSSTPELQWCVAVYSLCFILALVIILLTVGQVTTLLPFFDKIVIAYNILAAVSYITATVIWPLYNFRNNPRPPQCGYLCSWDKLGMVTFMTLLNLCVYSVDSVYSIWLVFCLTSE
ncbi:myeloid-associated differentiation marker-like [Syngnathoides biaculeatus]|uniref:myeloid-associated differentiation marker-like n=1 Tax=Syngnathoides biaculeatus TaxID=300417 RepID=UPI002ADE3386|nr:myeloid-associated differentiation marker-like [Syngnathoides biaculeatus]